MLQVLIVRGWDTVFSQGACQTDLYGTGRILCVGGGANAEKRGRSRRIRKNKKTACEAQPRRHTSRHRGDPSIDVV